VETNIFDYHTALLWKDENFDIASLRTTAGVPDLIALDGTAIQVPAFDGGTKVESIQGVKELNHDYKEGTPLRFHIHWMPTTADAGTVAWYLTYYIHSGGVKITGTLPLVATASGIAWKEQRNDFASLDLGALGKIGTQIHFLLYRDPTTDTYASDGAVATFGYHYQTDYRGSIQIASKTGVFL